MGGRRALERGVAAGTRRGHWVGLDSYWIRSGPEWSTEAEVTQDGNPMVELLI